MIPYKLFHQFFMIFWLGSLFLMPYLISHKFQGAKKLYWRLEFPCMLLSLILGLILLLQHPEKMKNGMFHMKLTCVFILVGLDLWTGTRKELTKRAQYIVQTSVGALVLAILFAISNK